MLRLLVAGGWCVVAFLSCEGVLVEGVCAPDWRSVQPPPGAYECAVENLATWKRMASRGNFTLNGHEDLVDGAELRGWYMEYRLWEDDLEEYLESDVLDPTEFGYSFYHDFPIYSKDVFLGVLRVVRRFSPDGSRVSYRWSGFSDLQEGVAKMAQLREAVDSLDARFAGTVGFRSVHHESYAIVDTPDGRCFLPMEKVTASLLVTLNLESLRLNAISLNAMEIVKRRLEAELREEKARRVR